MLHFSSLLLILAVGYLPLAMSREAEQHLRIRERLGDKHAIFSTEPSLTLPIVNYIHMLYDFSLASAHLHSVEFQATLQSSESGDVEGLSEIDLDVHKRFYGAMKADPYFLELYRDYFVGLLKVIHPDLYYIAIQRLPNIRFHLPGTVVVPPHKDTDDETFKTAHPFGEENFLLAITESFNTSAMYIESSENRGDYKHVQMEMGDIFIFDGNNCTHGNRINVEVSVIFLKIVGFAFAVLILK